jgi:hypothetical protein
MSNNWVIRECLLGNNVEKGATAKFKLLWLHLNEGTEKNHETYCEDNRSPKRHLNINLFDSKQEHDSPDKDVR